MIKPEDFIVVNNELQKYIGTDTNVIIPDGITSIASEAFYSAGKMSDLESVVIPNTVTRIGANAFQMCYQLVKVDMPDSVISIGSGAFKSCYNLVDLKLPNGLEIIESATFSGCEKLNIEIPESVVRIQSSAFQYGGLTNLTLSKNVAEIGRQAFESCKMEKVEILGDTLFEDISSAFGNCQNFTEFLVAEDNSRFKVIDGCLYTKDVKTLVAVPYAIKNLVIPEGVEVIGKRACAGTAIENIVFSSSLKKIDEQAFFRCNSIKELTIAGTIKEIGRQAISSNQLEKLVIEEGVETLEYGAIGGIMKGIVVPSSLKNIEEGAIAGNDKGFYIDLTKVGSNTNIHKKAFNGGNYAYAIFSKALGYEPEYVKVIFSDLPFEDLTYNDICNIALFPLDVLPSKEYKKVAILKYVEDLRKWNSYTKDFKNERDEYLTLNYKDWLIDAIDEPLLMAYFAEKKIISVDEALEILNGEIAKEEVRELLLDYTRSKKCKKGFSALPENTTSIGCFAFYQNNENVNFLIPDSVVSIGSFAFAVNNNLKSITMGSCLKNIGKQAFVSCNSLQEIKFNGTKEKWNNVYKDAKWNLNVPAKKVTCLDGEVIL